jgi:phosphatidylinositol-3-phosphatase
VNPLLLQLEGPGSISTDRNGVIVDFDRGFMRESSDSVSHTILPNRLDIRALRRSSILESVLIGKILGAGGMGEVYRLGTPSSAATSYSRSSRPPSRTIPRELLPHHPGHGLADGAGKTRALAPLTSRVRSIRSPTHLERSGCPERSMHAETSGVPVPQSAGRGVLRERRDGEGTMQRFKHLGWGSTACAGLLGVAMPAAAQVTEVPRLEHIIVVVMENHAYDQVRTLPYIASLITAGSSFSSSYGVTHPSLPNYIALWSGGTQGVTNDNCPAPGSPFYVENLGHACEAAGLTWRAYSEDLPAPGSTVCTASSSNYARKHAPWSYFPNLDHMNERPYTDLATDISQGTLPNLAFVVPNQCNDQHSCALAVGDTWLSYNIPSMLAGVGPHGVVILTYDEDDRSAGNQILTCFAGDPVRPNYLSPTVINHYTLLRTLCEALGLAPFGAAANETPITDVWVPSSSVEAGTWGAVKHRYRIDESR